MIWARVQVVCVWGKGWRVFGDHPDFHACPVICSTVRTSSAWAHLGIALSLGDRIIAGSELSPDTPAASP